MRYTLLITSLAYLFLCGRIEAQTVDYNRIILPDGAQDVTFEERLVQLAWKNYPETQIAREEVKVAQEQLKDEKTKWTGYFGVAGNLNESNIKSTFDGTGNTGNDFFPRYNFYGRLPMSMIFNDPHVKKAAAARARIAEDRVNLLKLDIRAEVLRRYQELKVAESIWVIRQQTLADEESNFLLVEQKFKNGETMVEDYIRAQRNRNDLKIQVAMAEGDYQKAKLSLEQMIGVRLEDVK